MRNYRDIIAYFSKEAKDAKVNDPHVLPPSLIAGHAAFRPYAEPLLNPKIGELGPHYDTFEKVFVPGRAGVEKKTILYDPVSNQPEEQKIISPNTHCLDNLMKPSSELGELLPEGAQKEDYLPAIRLAIRLTSWKHSLQEKCRQAWKRWKNRKQAKIPNQNPGLVDWNNYSFQEIWGKQAANEYEVIKKKLGLDDEIGYQPPRPEDHTQTQKRIDQLESAYNALQSVLDDYQEYGLLHYRPLQDSSRVWAAGRSHTFQTIKRVIDSWSQLYDAFTHTKIGDYSNPHFTLENTWESDQLRSYSSIHRQMQSLPSCLIHGMPLFPDLRDPKNNKDAYFDAVVQAVTRSADFLGNALETCLAKIPHSRPDNQTIDKYRSQINTLLSRGIPVKMPITSPGPHLVEDDLRKLPVHLIPLTSNKEYQWEELTDVSAEIYYGYLQEMETFLQEITNFPEISS